MWDYTERVKEHYRNPKNVGEIEDADGIGEVGSLSCGDALKLYLKIDENGIITDAKFQTFGCGSAVASSSILTEMIIGKTIEEAKKITNQDIAEELGGLPPEKMHCSVMGMEALQAAVADYKGEEFVEPEDDKLICKCFNVHESKIRQIVKENNLTSVREVSNFSKAGGGCGQCLGEIQEIIDAMNAEKNKDKPQELTGIQLVLKVNKVIESYISNELAKDGGGIELLDVKDNQVFVRLHGSCRGCPSSNITLKNFVQKTLQEHVRDDIEVIEN